MSLWQKKEKRERISSAEAFRRAAQQEQRARLEEETYGMPLPEQPQESEQDEIEEIEEQPPQQPKPKKQSRWKMRRERKPEKNEPVQAKKKQPQSDVPRLEQIRRRKHERRMRRAALALIALIAFFLYLGGIFSASINLFSDLLDSARIAVTPGKGWPVEQQVEGAFDLQTISGGIALCGASDLVLYSNSARQLHSVHHGYASPAMTTGNTRICVYDRGGKELRVESRSRTLVTKTTEYPILTADMAAGGTLAVATRSERYLAEITVYDLNFEEIYYAYLAEYYPYLVELSRSGNQMAVACVKVQNGAFGAQLQLYDLNAAADAQRVTIDLPNCTPLQLHYSSDGMLVVICAEFSAVYDPKTGDEVARYDYGQESLLTADFYGRNTLLVFDRVGNSTGSCLLLGEEMQPLTTVSFDFSVADAALGSENFYLIGDQLAVGYDLTGQQVLSQELSANGHLVTGGRHPIAVTAKEILQLTPLKNK